MVILRALCNIIGNSLPRILIKVSYSRYYLNRLSIQSSFHQLQPLLDCIGRSSTNTAAESYVDLDFACSCYTDLALTTLTTPLNVDATLAAAMTATCFSRKGVKRAFPAGALQYLLPRKPMFRWEMHELLKYVHFLFKNAVSHGRNSAGSNNALLRCRRGKRRYLTLLPMNFEFRDTQSGGASVSARAASFSVFLEFSPRLDR